MPIRLRVVFGLLGVGLAYFGFIEPDVATAIGRLNPKLRAAASSPGPILADPVFLTAGSPICSRDLAYMATFCDRMIAAGKDGDSKYENTSEIAKEALKTNPQTTRFEFNKANGRFWLSPVGPIPVKPTRKVDAQIAIVGGEMSALCTAVEAADQGYEVAILYSGPLGGISADNGANLRYFDVMPKTSHPIGQKKIWRYLKVPGYCALPTGLSKKLEKFFNEKYWKNVQLIKTSSYDDMVARMGSRNLKEIDTPEKISVRADLFIDMDPESRLAEKCGIKMTTDTPQLSYGLVFDLVGIQDKDWKPLGDRKLVAPEAIAKRAGVDLAKIETNNAAFDSMRLLRKENARSYNLVGNSYRLGYTALAQGYDFYMRCLGVARPSDKNLAWLNAHRCVSGFNISSNPKDIATVNSISYKIKQSILQHSHSLSEGSQFKPIRECEIPSLQRYFRWVTGNGKLTVRMPEQLYVRRASAFFETDDPYVKAEFNKPSKSPYHTYYPMDLRDLHPRDQLSWPFIKDYVKKAKFSHFWDCKPSATRTAIENLFLVNRSAATPIFYGGQRIEGNQINMGAALIASFGLPKPDRSK